MAVDLMNVERGQIPLTVILALFEDLKSQIIYNCKNSKHYTKALKRIRYRKLKKKSCEFHPFQWAGIYSL